MRVDSLYGYKVKGAPILSALRGRVIMEDGEGVGEKGYGESPPVYDTIFILPNMTSINHGY